ncbi:MAG: hypothetical protein EPO27_17560 [Betaproteobacteria bacterium]|nr:MAG: hypothetical protein EPO27_17560 [Betaproteobacteria bacterium]
MLNLSAQQLAELLIGIARAQAAVIHGVDNANPGIKTQNIVPALQNAAHLRDHPEPTLTDLPVRILLTSQGRVPPDPATVARELERLIAGTSAAASPAEAATAIAGPADGGDLDFSSPAS